MTVTAEEKVVDTAKLMRSSNSPSTNTVDLTSDTTSGEFSQESRSSWQERNSLTSSGDLSGGGSTQTSSRRKSSLLEGLGTKSILEHQRHNDSSTTREMHDFTINKLRYESVGICGREKEREILQKGLDRVASSKTRQLVMLSGSSGTGKSMLAMSLADPVRKLKGVFVAGKFDVYLRGEPFAGIIDALDELCGEIVLIRATDPPQFTEIKRQIIRDLGSEIHLLRTIIPHLEDIFDGNDDEIPDADLGNVGNLEARSQQLNYTFRRFIRLVCSHVPPLVIVLDDLQWADMQSLELLKVLATDRENSSLMIIGCYRSDEVNSTHALPKSLRDLQATCQRDNYSITEMSIGNLGLEETNQIVMALISIDEASRTRGLAEICHKRTHGNPFFLISFLKMLNEEDLLEFNLGLFQWKWDEAVIEEKTAATANVVDLLTKKMKESSDEVVRFLQLAACLGSTFDENVIHLSWRGNEKGNVEEPLRTCSAFGTLLEKVITENFLEQDGPSRYRWVHDNVQEAAMSLISPAELASFQFDLGMTLFRELKQDEWDGVIFVVVDLLNKKFESLGSSSENLEIARQNLRAAEKAKKVSAFVSASKYGAAGICLLPNDQRKKWEDNFQLSLDLYSIGAEAECIRGNAEAVDVYCDEALNQKGFTVFDKLRLYNALLESRGSHGRTREALDLCLNVLGQLHCKFSKRKAGQVFRVIKTISELKRSRNNIPTTEDIKNLPLMTDRARVESMSLMKRLVMYCYMTGNTMLMVLVLTRQFRWTMRYGVDACSPVALNGYGLLMMAVLGDFHSGTKYAELSLLMLQRLKTKATESATLRGAHFYILPWTKPLQHALKPLTGGYEVGMQVGDSESACECLLNLICTLLVSGKSLHQINEDCRLYVAQMEELNRIILAQLTRIIWQTVLNLTGHTDDAKVLVGEAVDERELLQNVESKIQSKMLENCAGSMKTFLFAYLAEHQLGAELALAKGNKYLKEVPCHLIGMWETFSRGISLYAMARRTGMWKYKKHALKVKKTVETWFGNGNPNVSHHLRVLNAEQAALDGKNDQARQLYGEAITLSARGGFIHDAALASERYADFLLDNDRDEAEYRLGESIRFYSQWGATQKIAMLRESHAGLVTSMPSTSRIVSVSDSPFRDSDLFGIQ